MYYNDLNITDHINFLGRFNPFIYHAGHRVGAQPQHIVTQSLLLSKLVSTTYAYPILFDSSELAACLLVKFLIVKYESVNSFAARYG